MKNFTKNKWKIWNYPCKPREKVVVCRWRYALSPGGVLSGAPTLSLFRRGRERDLIEPSPEPGRAEGKRSRTAGEIQLIRKDEKRIMENKFKRFLSLLLALVMVIGMLPAGIVRAEAAEGDTTSPAYTKEVDGYVRVWGEGGGKASESFVLKLYSGETLIATTQLNNVGGIIDGDVNVTWNFFYPESNDEYWTTTWEEGQPNSAAQPTKVELWIDGTKVNEADAKMSGADDVDPVVWEELGGVKKIVTGLSGSGTEEDPYLINKLEELLWFQAKVDEQASDGSTQFAGKYFKLNADIDLADTEWNPIGSMSGDHGSFQGVFDGGNHTISNLNVQTAGNGLGLFARTAGNAEIKNLTLNNVTVKSTDNSNYVGGVVGNAYASTKISNVHVTGTIDISGCGYIGGIAGHGYVVMDNVSVNGEGTIRSTFWCAGGILGYGGEGTTDITNATVEGTGNGLTITSAAGGLGAIVGMAEDNNGTQPTSGSNLSAKNVDIKTHTGVYGDTYANYALGYLYGGNPTSKLTGTLSVEDVKVETSNGEEPEINDAVATIGDAVYFNLQSAVDAAQDSDTVTLLRDVANVGVITIDKPVTIDLDGKTVNLQQLKIASNITVEVKNGSLVGTSADYDTIRSEVGNLILTDVNVSGLRHTVRIKSGTATINGGTYTYGGTEVVYKTLNIINVGDDEDPENTKANVTIKAGTFVGPKGYAYDGGCAVKVQAGSTVTIEGGSFSMGVQSVVHADDTATLSITGGTFDQDPSAYVASGYEATETNGTYTVAEAATDHTPDTAVCHPLTVTGGIVTVKNGDKDVTDTLTVTTDEATGKKTYSVPKDAKVTVTLDKTLIPEGMVFDIWSTGKFSLPLGQDYKAETITFTMSSDVDIAAQYRDATIEDDGPGVLGTVAIIGTAAVGGAVLGYQAYSLGAEFAGKLMALPYFPSNRSALAMMLWEDAGKPMPESELLYPDVGQEERDMDLQHAARWAMENELIPDLNDEGTAPEEMKFYPDNAVSKIDVLNAWQKAQELKQNA